MKTVSEKEKLHRFLKKVYKQEPYRELESLQECDRWFQTDFEYGTAYGFLPENFEKLTDEEIKRELQENMMVTINSPYDCTGKWCTCWLHFHRNPSGHISFVHHMGLDV